MKVAVPVTKSNQIDDHFGHCEFYNVYTISDTNEIIKEDIINSEQGCGCKSNIAGTLAEKGVEILLAGGIGGGAIQVLKNAGIEVIRGCSGNADIAVKKFAVGLIVDNGISCSHHNHHGDSDSTGHICNH
jgi:predicted Fe-Mo cluster-binding NifX family protein